MSSTSRRRFLIRSGQLTLGAGLVGQLGWLAGCGDDTASSPSTTATMAPGPPVTGPDWGALAAAIDGDVVLPADPAFADARLPFNARYDALAPLAVAFCTSTADVQAAVRFATAAGVPLVARNGRHSYAGYSTGDGLIVDVSRITDVQVSGDGTRADIGGGALLVDAYDGLADHGVSISGGTCPTVGLSGLALGGGFGMVSRRYGTTSDNLREAEVVTAAGEVVVANEHDNADLFWALRGGGGGNFGITTRLTLDTFPADDVTTFQVTWPWTSARAVTTRWQEWLETLPDEVFSILRLLTQDPDGIDPSPSVFLFGQLIGPRERLDEILRPLLDPALGAPTTTTIEAMSFFDSVELWGGCVDLSVAQCREPYMGAQGKTARASFAAKSDFVTDPLGAGALDVIIDHIERRQADPVLTGRDTDFFSGSIQLDSWGGALNRPAPDATAFVHRDARCHAQYLAYWADGAGQDVVDANVSWLNGFRADLSPHLPGSSYVNYIDPDLADWAQAYYGANLDRLRQVKRRWDPDGVFTFAQSIPPA